ncbi:hypothetical protein, partial [Enterococcus casseliflavus]|uniref:hypothetical protein n=1 Tax=Enterococcus casseliflavus TaxID=37734 RepID=UPI003A4C5FFB
MNREEILQTIKDLIANGNIEEANALLNEQATFLADYYDQAAGLFENLDTVQIPFFNNKETILLFQSFHPIVCLYRRHCNQTRHYSQSTDAILPSSL